MAAAILNHSMTAAQMLADRSTTPRAETAGAASSTGGTNDTTTSGSATISANDFLTLLVTEMQNQDPTADTDPNEYINQLVQVNSLEQLIDINQTLSGALDSSAASSGTYAATSPQDKSTTEGAASPAANLPGVSANGSGAAAESIAGNLPAPAVSAAADRVGHALGGQSRIRPEIHGVAALR